MQFLRDRRRTKTASTDASSSLDAPLLADDDQGSVRFVPKLRSRVEGIHTHVVPPGALVADVVELAVMGTAEGDGELVADLAADRLWLGKADVMGVGRDRATENARLRCDMAEMVLVAERAGFAYRSALCADCCPRTARGPIGNLNLTGNPKE